MSIFSLELGGLTFTHRGFCYFFIGGYHIVFS